MFELTVIILVCVTVLCLFIPEKYLPKGKRHPRRNQSRQREGGLPWTGKNKCKKKDYFWD